MDALGWLIAFAVAGMVLLIAAGLLLLLEWVVLRTTSKDDRCKDE